MPNTAQFWSMAPDGAGTSLYILDEIARYGSWYFDTVTPKRFQSDLNRCSGDLQVWIDSPGGDAFAGAAIYSMLRAYSSSGRGRVIANIAGMAASAAGLIAMAADEVRISLTGTFMLHDPLCAMEGNADELRYNAGVLDEIREGQIAAYMRKSGKSHDEVLALMRGSGTYMNASTAIENGFADKLLNDDDGQLISMMANARVSSCADHQAAQLRSIMEHRRTIAPATAQVAKLAACETTVDKINADGSLAGAVDDIVQGILAGIQSCSGTQEPEEPTPETLEEITPTEPADDPQERDAQVRALLRACLS